MVQTWLWLVLKFEQAAEYGVYAKFRFLLCPPLTPFSLSHFLLDV